MQIRDRIRDFRRVRAGDLIPNPKNWRTHPPEQREALRDILKEVGYADALLARETDDGLMLIDGHLRAEENPDQVVPLLVLDLNEAEADKLLLTLDPLAAMAGAESEKLDALLKSMETESKALASMYEAMAAEHGLEEIPDIDEGPDAQISRAAELMVEWGTEPGQLWRIGRHLLLCGDARQEQDVRLVLAEERASCVFTDPPYGVGIGAKNRMLNEHQRAGRCLDDIEDDSLTPEQLHDRLLPAFVNIRKHAMADDCTVFVMAPQRGELSMMMMSTLRDAGLPVRHVLIWMKNSPTFSMGRLDYDYQHEPILLTWGKRHKRPMKGQHRTSVWKIDKPRACDLHPTMKPVELVANAFLNNSDAGDHVFDPYVGSGTSILAAEQLGRVCHALEITPEFTAVVLQRCKDAGLHAELIA